MKTHPTTQLFIKGDRRLAIVLLAPAAVLLALVVVYPLATLFYNSLFAARLTDQASTLFIGLKNYADLLYDRDVRLALLTTIVFAIITIPGALLIGLLLALAGNLEWRWRWPVRLALLLPWAMPMSFTGMIFAWFFNTEYGVVNDLLVRAGLSAQPFLLSPWLAIVAVSMALIWKTSSFVALILLPGLQTIPRSLYEAARVEGASAWQQFRHITLPLLVPSIVVALIFRTTSAIQTFDIPYAMTQGGPGQATQTLAMLVNTVTTEYLDVGYGSSLAVLLFGLCMLANFPYLRHLSRSLR